MNSRRNPHSATHILALFLILITAVIAVAIIRFLSIYGLAIVAGFGGWVFGRRYEYRRLMRAAGEIINHARYSEPVITVIPELTESPESPESPEFAETPESESPEIRIARAALLSNPRSGAHSLGGDELCSISSPTLFLPSRMISRYGW